MRTTILATMLIAGSAHAASQEAEALGVKIAGSGPMSGLLPLIVAKETEEMVASHPELSAADQAVLRATAGEVSKAGIARANRIAGHAYAERLSVADLRAIAAFNATPAAARYHAAQPKVMAETMAALGTVDFKRETMAAFCKKTGKGCAK